MRRRKSARTRISSREMVTTSIHALPEEVLIIIFSYCSYSELVDCLQFVCTRWQQVSRSKLLWKNLVYAPGADVRERDIIVKLRRSPRLQAVDFSMQVEVSADMVRTLGQSCHELRVLHFAGSQDVSVKSLRSLQMNCPDIEELSIADLIFMNIRKVKVLADFTRMKTLIVKGINKRYDTVELIANEFPHLEHLELRNVLFTKKDLEHLMERKQDHLSVLTLCCSTRDHYCVLPYLSHCTHLKSLTLERLCRHFELLPFEAFPNLPTVSFLMLTFGGFLNISYCKAFFKSFSQIKELHLFLCQVYESDDIISLFARECPLLQKITFNKCYGLLNDQRVMELLFLKQLKSLTIISDHNITDKAMEYLQNLPNLRYLSFYHCDHITEKSLKILSDFPKLEFLEFSHCKRMSKKSVMYLKRKLPHLLLRMENPIRT
ncbi:F-box/LRR-repeat protein 2 [Anabrus simplex]|uniref:F-box/LRR-repeat protein 2 n=1 Tax=Anabrus simplex TaxID=316456 RepID=UPI0035A2D0FD